VIIDGHNHLGGPDRGDKRSQSGAELVATLDESGIDKAIIFPFNNPDAEGSFAAANKVIAAAVAEYPDRLIGFARFDPHYHQALAELDEAILSLGLRGVKLHPRGQDFHLDDPDFLCLMDRIVDLDVRVIFDSGTSHARWADIAKLAARYPKTPLIMAHMRGEGFMDAALAHDNIYLGTTDIKNRQRIESAVSQFGAERVISGSDSPYISPQIEQDKINALSISDADKVLISGGNIERLLRDVLY